MGVSLETRAPFLDHHVMEFVWRLLLSSRIHNARRKWLLTRHKASWAGEGARVEMVAFRVDSMPVAACGRP